MTKGSMRAGRRLLPGMFLAALLAGSLGVFPPLGAGESRAADGYHLPFASPERGRTLFVDKGCVVCHSVNGVGGEIGPALDAEPGAPDLDPFDFAARMWRGARMMIALQELETGFQIELEGDELAHIARFLSDREAQQAFSEEDVPDIVRRLMQSDRLKELDL